MNCPNCGAQIDSFHKFCASCGSEVKSNNDTSYACKELTDRLQKIDDDNKSRNALDTVFKAFKSLSDSDVLNEVDNQKISLINSFSIPNTKVDIMEFLFLSKANIEMYSDLLKNCHDSNQIKIYKAYQNVWQTKLEQAFSLGDFHLNNDTDFLKMKVEDEKEKKETEETEKKKKIKEKKTMFGLGIIIALCFILLFIIGRISPSKEDSKANIPSNGIPVSIHLECVPNLWFSKYDIKIKIDDEDFQRLEHGTTQDFTAHLTVGTHKISFFEAGTTPVKGSVEFEVKDGSKLSYKLYCYDEYISITDLNEPKTEVAETTIVNTTSAETTSNEETVYYYSKTKETYKDGNTGVYAYSRAGFDYIMYYIIDFDNGYVYEFADYDSSCFRAKFAGDSLNSGIKITHNEDDTIWNEFLHFKWKSQPDHLIYEMDDWNDPGEYDYYPTDLSKALELKDSKEIVDIK